MVSECPISERICLTASALALASLGMTAAWCAGPWRPTAGLRPISAPLPRLVGNLVQLDAALPRDLRRRDQGAQTVHGGAHHVVGIGRAQALGQDVRNACALQDRPHRPAGYDAGTGGCGLEQDSAGTVLTNHLVGNGGAGLGHLDHRALGGIHRLPHGLGDLVRLTGRHSDLSLPVAHCNQRIEGEAPAALHHLGHPVDRDDVLDMVAGPVAVAPTTPGPAAPAAVAPLSAAAAPSPGALCRRGPLGSLSFYRGAALERG